MGGGAASGCSLERDALHLEQLKDNKAGSGRRFGERCSLLYIVMDENASPCIREFISTLGECSEDWRVL